MAKQWRGVIAEYADRLPAEITQVPVSLGEGGTPLVPAPVLSELTGAEVHLKFEGMKVGNGKLFDEFEAILDMTEATPIVQVRANRSGSTTFIKSYDGVSASTGENFQQKIAHLQATHDKVDGPYNTVELPFALTKAIKEVPESKEGFRLGVTPPMTGTDEWNAFYKSLRDQGLSKSKIRVRVFHIPRTNRNGNEWGITGYELLGEVN